MACVTNELAIFARHPRATNEVLSTLLELADADHRSWVKSRCRADLMHNVGC